MIDLVLNRRARHLVGDGPVRRALLEAAKKTGARVFETSTLAELDEAARAIAVNGAGRVVLAGGDGAYMAGVTALVRAFGDRPLPAVALAPGGTVGTIARNFRSEGGASLGRFQWNAAGAEHIVRGAAAGRGTAVRRPTLRVVDDRGGDRVGFIFGAGLVASFFDEYYAAPKQGYAGAAGIVARVFAGSFVGGGLAKRVLDPVGAALSVDGEAAKPEGWSLVLASVIRDVGLHMWVTPRGGETPGAFHAVASPLGPRALGPQLPRVLLGQRLRGEGHVDVPAARDLSLRFAEGGAYVLDGDLLHARDVRVTAGPPIDVLAL
ncbi:MAG TPA: diacylglycerol kinase family protein [Polyangiaceae bacterium]|jgi:diacylglycerol kinase family enzyme